MNTGYNSTLIKQLRDQQVRVASREKKLEHVNRAEKFLAELDPDRSYPYEYLCYRITEYRPETAAAVALRVGSTGSPQLDTRARVVWGEENDPADGRRVGM